MTDSTGLNVGDRAPEFTAPLVSPDGTTADTSLSSLLEEAPVFLCFYTNDFSPDCIKEWCSFRDYNWFSLSEEFQIVGLSKSHPFTHRRFINHFNLNFPLYADSDLSVTEKFNVKYRTFKVLPRPRRSCFLIDQNREIKFKWISEHPLDPTRDLPSLAELQQAIEQELGIV